METTEEGELEVASLPSNDWLVLTEYEQTEVAFSILKQFSQHLFQKDYLRLVEREEMFNCVKSDFSSEETTLTIYGHVSFVRKDAFRFLVQRIRLHLVQNLRTAVTIGYKIGDRVPSLLVEPLCSCSHTDAYRRWYHVYHAMRCGIITKMYQRQEKVQERLQKLITGASPKNVSPAPGGAAFSPAILADDEDQHPQRDEMRRFYKEQFGQLTADTKEGLKGPIKLPLEAYVNALNETRVDIATIAATVPTVFIAWSYKHHESVEWLCENLLHDKHLREIRETTGLSSRYAILLDKDPWLDFVAQYNAALPRCKAQEEDYRINLLQSLAKRAQIVLLNVDDSKSTAKRHFETLLLNCRGWRSPEVPLISLWLGSDGLRSELATTFNIRELPFIFATTPGAARRQNTNFTFPTVTFTTSNEFGALKDDGEVSEISPVALRMTERGIMVPIVDENADKNTWHGMDAKQRAKVVKHLRSFLIDNHIPLCLSSVVDRHIYIGNPFTKKAKKALRSCCTSHISLSGGLISASELQPIAKEMNMLHQLKNFRWKAQLMEKSAPLQTTYDPVTPRRRLQLLTQVVSCAFCKSIILIDSTPHFRCLHCPQAEGLLCEGCAVKGAATHPAHHIFLRVPPGSTKEVLPLLWGPSNVFPLHLFRGHLVTNQQDWHCGSYCDRCRKLIRGVRWKCAVCHQYDLCDSCAVKRRITEEPILISKNAVAKDGTKGFSFASMFSPLAKSKHDAVAEMSFVHNLRSGHSPSHPMLYFPVAQGSTTLQCLGPKLFSDLSEWLDAVIERNEIPSTPGYTAVT